MIAGLVRELVLVSLASALGGLVLGFVFPGSDAPDLDAARARLRRWITACLVVLLVATCAELVVRTQAMSDASLAASVASVPSVMTGTHLGQILTARLAAVVVALLLSFELGRVFRAIALLATLAIALSLSLTGHAADWGDLTLSVGVDWAHAVAASTWAGGLIALALVAGRGGTTWSRESLAAVASGFSRLAGLSLLAVVVTGSYNAWVQLGALSRLLTTNYGRVLVVKLLLVAVLVWLGAVNRYRLLPRLAPSRAPHGLGARVFRMSRLAVFGPGRGELSARAKSRLVAYITVEGAALGPERPASGDRDAAARGRRARTHRLRQARVRQLSCDPGSKLHAADETRAGPGGNRRTPPGRARRVDHESEREDPRWAGLHRRAWPVDHAGL